MENTASSYELPATSEIHLPAERDRLGGGYNKLVDEKATLVKGGAMRGSGVIY